MKRLHKYLSGIKEKEKLAHHTTFKVGGAAEFFYVAKNSQDVVKALNIATSLGVPFEVMAGGSNILASDDGFPGLVIKIGGSNYKIIGNNIEVEAGVPLSFILSKAATSGLAGMEWAAGIPGTIGGAVIGNAGSFEKSMSDILDSVVAYDSRKREVVHIKNRDCKFGYRNSIFKNTNLVVLSCLVNLSAGDKEKISQEIEKNMSYKKTRHPIGFSAGSIFKNLDKKHFAGGSHPQMTDVIKWHGKIPVGLLIDNLGLKGHKIGGAMISDKHGNFILNTNNASAENIKSLIDLAKRQIKDKYGVVLEEEIRYIGNIN